VVLIGQGQCGVRLDGILRGGSDGTGGDGEVIRQADTQARADLGAIACELVVVLAIDRADESVAVLEQANGFPRDLVEGEKGITHGALTPR
jgi:hypothetical protein